MARSKVAGPERPPGEQSNLHPGAVAFVNVDGSDVSAQAGMGAGAAHDERSEDNRTEQEDAAGQQLSFSEANPQQHEGGRMVN